MTPDASDELAEQVGLWTQIKLSVLSRYIGYRNEKGTGGGFLNATVRAAGRYYVDGHASYGHDVVAGVFRRNGTPLIALEAKVQTKDRRVSRFTHLWFVEIDEDRAAELEKNVERAGGKERADVIPGDINEAIETILPKIPAGCPTLCMLDPYDPDDLKFRTVRAIAEHQAGLRKQKIELFVNLPIGLQQRQARDPKTNVLRPNVVRNLVELLGNDRWLPAMEGWARGELPWYEVYTRMKRSFEEELRALGYTVYWEMDVPPVNPFYALVFAATHPLAGPIMESAMKDWERDPANPQRPLFE